MAFQAKLFINDQERNVLDSTFLYKQLIDSNGRPKTNIHGGKISLLIESTKNDELFYDWMFSTHTMYNGYVRFYKRDGFSKLFEFEFANCHCVHLTEKFNAEGYSPLKMELVLSPGIQRVRGQIFEKNWNPSNPFASEAVPVTMREEREPEFNSISYFDVEDNEIEEIRFTDISKIKVGVSNIDEGETIGIMMKRENGDGVADNKKEITFSGTVEDGYAVLEEVEMKRDWEILEENNDEIN